VKAEMQGGAILLFGNDVTPHKRAEYEHWHAAHHVPQRLEVPGILGAIRFRSAGALTPNYFTFYRLASVEVLESDAYRALVERPDAETLAMRAHILRPLRFVARVERIPSIPPDSWMVVETAPTSFAWPARAPCTIEGRLVDGQRNHPIMGEAKLPRGMIRLSFAPVEFLEAHLPEGRPGQMGNYFRPLDRFGLDAF
jgi:hypothetical protein